MTASVEAFVAKKSLRLPFNSHSIMGLENARKGTARYYSMLPEQIVGAGINIGSSMDSAVASTTALVATSASRTVVGEAVAFDPVIPDMSALLGMGGVLVICIVAGFVWANEVVPVSRTKLAISKNRGEVKEYLDELQERTPKQRVELSGLEVSDAVAVEGESLDGSQEVEMFGNQYENDGRGFERWLFSDWLNSRDKKSGTPGRQKEPALPILKKAKWNSGDNPVLVTCAIMGVGVILATVTERVSLILN
eukprot:CAMPEP_0198296152 /NCGR_PEP_ID=MMETSP1449-20131203/31184_1 /TAXON_ID=420275 /ORGANISM="Attheya septentrionalis, Strain CCMP2084" /LENGTH=250 /DNA_ID=CAMNT_0043996675 /DNA_START=253 /DNA_END=1005 /DNA_ORIENTATION=+